MKEIEKTEWVVKGGFGIRRIWKHTDDPDLGHFFVVNNMEIQNVYDAESIKVFKAKTVQIAKALTQKEIEK